MTAETTILLLLPVLGSVHFVAGGGIPRIIEQGLQATFYGPRDDLPPFESKYAQRMERVNENFKETLPYAVALLLLVQFLGLAIGSVRWVLGSISGPALPIPRYIIQACLWSDP